MKYEMGKEARDAMFERDFIPLLKPMYKIAFFLEEDEDRAKDLLQESFIRAYKMLHYFEAGTNHKAWIIRIIKNTFVNEYHKRNRLKTLNIDDIIYENDEGENRPRTDLRHEIFGNMVGDEITRAVNSLPVNLRLVLLLCDVEGFKYDEIAKIIDAPIGTVRSRLHRAREQLKARIKDYAATRGYKDEETNDEKQE